MCEGSKKLHRLHKAAANATFLPFAEEAGASMLSPKLWKSSDLNQLPATAPFSGPSLWLLKCLILMLEFATAG